MSSVIQDGQFYGKVTGTRRLGDFVLAETRYGGGAIVPWHAHESPLVCLVLRGGLEERTGAGRRQCRAEQPDIILAADGARAERGEVRGHELAVEQGEVADPQSRHQPGQRDLRCIGHPAEHRFAEKGPA